MVKDSRHYAFVKIQRTIQHGEINTEIKNSKDNVSDVNSSITKSYHTILVKVELNWEGCGAETT